MMLLFRVFYDSNRDETTTQRLPSHLSWFVTSLKSTVLSPSNSFQSVWSWDQLCQHHILTADLQGWPFWIRIWGWGCMECRRKPAVCSTFHPPLWCQLWSENYCIEKYCSPLSLLYSQQLIFQTYTWVRTVMSSFRLLGALCLRCLMLMWGWTVAVFTLSAQCLLTYVAALVTGSKSAKTS